MYMTVSEWFHHYKVPLHHILNIFKMSNFSISVHLSHVHHARIRSIYSRILEKQLGPKTEGKRKLRF